MRLHVVAWLMAGLASSPAAAGVLSPENSIPCARVAAQPAADLPDAMRRGAAPSLEAMIGQMLIIGFPGSDPKGEWPARAAELIRQGRIGGVLLFADNIANRRQLGALTTSLVSAAPGIPPFIAVDQEGGKIQRLSRSKGFVGLPSAVRVGRMDVISAYLLYRKTAAELAGLDINVNLGPVVDLNINPQNPAIGGRARSYDRDPGIVRDYACQFIEAHAEAGVLTAAKHFPGHGSATTDSHKGPADVTRTWHDSELQPFADLIVNNQVGMIMVGHLVHPRFSDGYRPASISKRAIRDVLRGELGFHGLVITDDLDMDAVAETYRREVAAPLAVAAGADLLIIANNREPDPAMVDRVIAAIAGAVGDGRIPRATIEQSYRRIVTAKSRLAAHRAYVTD